MTQQSQEPTPELGAPQQDDQIIGTALKWSAVALVVIVVAVLSVLWFGREKEQVEEVIEKDAGTIADMPRPEVQLPTLPFVDRTEELGIDFVHVNGARGEKLLPETMGGGVAIFDADGDGDQDLLFVDGRSWSGDPDPAPSGAALYHNDGSGRFERALNCGLEAELYGMGVAVADYDADGDQDVYLAAVGANKLFRNDGGTFTDVTDEAGVAGDESEWSSSAGFFDADQDGDLDLFVCNYVKWSAEIDRQLAFTLNGQDRAYGPPTNYTGTQPYLFVNDGNGRFTEQAEAAGMHVNNAATGIPVAKSLGVVFVDFDHDHKLDVFVANDTVQNFLYHNQGGGRFEEIAATCGVGFDSRGEATGAMGVDCGRYRNDECLAIGIGNFANEMSSFYVCSSDRFLFTDDANSEGIGSPSRQALSFGLFFFDADLDGRLDVVQANGHLEDEIHEIQASQHYEQPAQLFWNAGPEQLSCYADLAAESVGDLSQPIVGRAAGYGDLDGDGDLDVVLTQSGRRPLVLFNEQSTDHHWLRIRLEGNAPNRDALGAEIELEAGGIRQYRTVSPTRSYLTQVELPITFGLGTHTSVDALRITWPDGTVQDVDVPAEVDCEIVVRRSSAE